MRDIDPAVDIRITALGLAINDSNNGGGYDAHTIIENARMYEDYLNGLRDNNDNEEEENNEDISEPGSGGA